MRATCATAFPRVLRWVQVGHRAEYDTEMLHGNLMFGTMDQVIEKLRRYERRGVDSFLYYASMRLGLAAEKRSLELFCQEFMPTFVP